MSLPSTLIGNSVNTQPQVIKGESINKANRFLPYNPLPNNSQGIGLSTRSKKEKAVKWDQSIKGRVHDKHGSTCYYCGALPGKNNHDCHEVFEINDKHLIIRLMDIVPACKACHEWADGKIFVSGILSKSLYWTKKELDAFMRKWGVSDKDDRYEDYWYVTQYRRMLHFRKVNRMQIKTARKYLLAIDNITKKRDQKNIDWLVEYCDWRSSAGLSEGELFSTKYLR